MINSCVVKTSSEYLKCMEQAAKNSNQGYCHGVNAIQRRNTSSPCKIILVYAFVLFIICLLSIVMVLSCLVIFKNCR